MYIRRSTRTYKGKTFTNYVLVESVHTAKGPRQRSICSLGDLGPRPRQEWLKLARKIEDALIGQVNLLEIDDAEVADIVGQVQARHAAEEKAPSSTHAKALIGVNADGVTTERHREARPSDAWWHWSFGSISPAPSGIE